MRIRATAAMATVLLCAASSGSAQDATAGEVHIYGSGTFSCGRWLADRRETNVEQKQSKYAERIWVLAWLSAAGAYNVRGELRQTDAEAVTAWVNNYCQEHPLNKIADAAASLVDELAQPK